MKRFWISLIILTLLWPYVLWPTRLLCPWNSLGKNTGMCSHSLFQGIFLTQVSCIAGKFFMIRATWEAPITNHSPQFSSVAQSCPTLCNPMNCSTPGLSVHHQLLESTQTHVHQISDAIQPSHPLSSPSSTAPNPSQHQGIFQWVSSSHQVAKILEFQLQHQSFQWTPRTVLL